MQRTSAELLAENVNLRAELRSLNEWKRRAELFMRRYSQMRRKLVTVQKRQDAQTSKSKKIDRLLTKRVELQDELHQIEKSRIVLRDRAVGLEAACHTSSAALRQEHDKHKRTKERAGCLEEAFLVLLERIAVLRLEHEVCENGKEKLEISQVRELVETWMSKPLEMGGDRRVASLASMSQDLGDWLEERQLQDDKKWVQLAQKEKRQQEVMRAARERLDGLGAELQERELELGRLRTQLHQQQEEAGLVAAERDVAHKKAQLAIEEMAQARQAEATSEARLQAYGHRVLLELRKRLGFLPPNLALPPPAPPRRGQKHPQQQQKKRSKETNKKEKEEREKLGRCKCCVPSSVTMSSCGGVAPPRAAAAGRVGGGGSAAATAAGQHASPTAGEQQQQQQQAQER